jgi:hypothetical protein
MSLFFFLSKCFKPFSSVAITSVLIWHAPLVKSFEEKVLFMTERGLCLLGTFHLM